MSEKSKTAYIVSSVNDYAFLQSPDDLWSCYLFGGDENFALVTLRMENNKRPNIWVRFWMRVFFGTRWRKNNT